MSYLVLFYNEFWYPPLPTRSFAELPEVEFTTDRSRLREADAVVFHLPTAWQIRDAVKYPGQLWVGVTMESTNRSNMLINAAAMRAFDLHMSFKRQSDVWMPYIPSLEHWQAAIAAPVPTPSEPAPAALFQSASTDQWGRDAYLTELMAYLKFDSYGRFLHNREVPKPDLGWDTKMALVQKYRFTLGFENTIEDDYVTEKFFQPLLAGSVPVYYGAPNVDAYAPGDNSFIDASKYTPRELAELLASLSADEDERRKYLAWRTMPLRPAFLELVAEVAEDRFLRLGRVIKARLDAGERSPQKTTTRPFGIHGLIATKLRYFRQAVRDRRRAARA